MNVRDSDIAALERKYAELRSLRSDLADSSVEPRARMRALAREFPGALRELDGLPIEVIEQRLKQLRTTLREGSAPLEWMNIHVAHHRILRVILTAKRWMVSLNGEYADPTTFETLASFEHDAESARIVAAALDRVREAPRSSRLALELTAQTLGLEESHVRENVWRDSVHEARRRSP